MSTANVLEKPEPREVRLQHVLGEILAIEDISSPAVLLNARLLFEIFVAGRKLDQQLLGCLRMAKWIDEQAFSLSGKRTKKIAKMVLNTACDLFVAAAFEQNATQLHILGILKSRDAMRLVTQMNMGVVTFTGSRIELGLHSLRTIQRYAQEIQRAGSAGITPHNPAAVTDIIGNMREMKKYGVKTVLMTDSLTHDADSCWVIRDSRDIVQLSFKKGTGDVFSGRNLIGVELADAGQFTHGPSLAMRKKTLINLPHASLQGFGAEYKARMAFGLTETGEFSVSVYNNLLPVRPIFERAGDHALAHYEMLRLTHALHLFDLVVPATVVERVSRVSREAACDGDGSPSNESFMRNLVIPRMRILEKRSDVVAALEEEVERADDDMIRRCNRPMKRHEVVCHPRRLAHGRRPSPQAVELAREYGVTLAENETFVKMHSRGEGDQAIITTTQMK